MVCFSSYGKFGNVRENLQLSKSHFAPFPLYRDAGIDDFVRGVTFQSSQNCDRFFSPEVIFLLRRISNNLHYSLYGISLFADHGSSVPREFKLRFRFGSTEFTKRSGPWSTSVQRLARSMRSETRSIVERIGRGHGWTGSVTFYH